jgi:uncharacterized protein (TIGR00255 family)
MIVSMTGFGKANCKLQRNLITIEIKSVNSKQLDLYFKLPNFIKEKENDFRTLITQKTIRGKVEVSCYLNEANYLPKKETEQINKPLLKQYFTELKKLDKELNANTPNLLELALNMPNVINSNNSNTLTATDEAKIIKTFKDALQKFTQHRKEEGKKLEKDLLLHIKNLNTLLKKVEQEDKKRLPQIKNSLLNKLEQAVQIHTIDNNRLEQELIYYLGRNDITEEKVRLKTHLDYFIKTCNEDTPGRKLAFISQEIGREINTIGSKANYAEIQKLVVEMKDELEKIKEQLNNVL